MTETKPDNPPRIVTCPTCEARVKWTQSNPDRPFCSERCKLIDLGAWADERHAIPGEWMGTRTMCCPGTWKKGEQVRGVARQVRYSALIRTYS